MYIGLDIGGTNMVAGLTNGAGKIINKVSRPVNKAWDPAELCRQSAQLAQQAAEVGGFAADQIKAVGLGLPGLVDNKTGYVIQTPNMPFDNTPIREMFQAEWDVPVYLGNDANCAAIGEYWAGAAKGCDPAVVVTLGTGIGAGIIHNGKIFHGGNGMAGEVGHTCIDYQGLPCPCGRRGCWEQYASASALKRFTAQAQLGNPDSILARVIREHDGHVSGQSAFMAARLGDPVGQQVCDMYVGYLAAGIANVVNIFQPDTLAIGGGVSNESDEQLLHPLQQLVERETIPCSAGKKTRIVKAQLGNQAGIIGAALLGKKKRI